MGLIEVTDLVKRYGRKTAIDRLSFTIGDACVYGILGPEGAGKTTLMNLLAGCLGADEGSIQIQGIAMDKKSNAASAKIGYLPQQPPVYPLLTVREYLDFAAQLKQVDKKKRAEQIQEVMQLTGITELAGRMIRGLSTVEILRTGIAQALLGTPEVILLDEPTAGLSPKQAKEIRELIRSLGKAHTVIFSSHMPSDIREICDEVLVLADGRIVAQGAPDVLSTTGKQTEETGSI